MKKNNSVSDQNGKVSGSEQSNNTNGMATNTEYENLRKIDCVAFSIPLPEVVAPDCFEIFYQLVEQDRRNVKLQYGNGMLIFFASKPHVQYENDGPVTLLTGSALKNVIPGDIDRECPVPFEIKNNPAAKQIAVVWLVGDKNQQAQLRRGINARTWGSILANIADGAAEDAEENGKQNRKAALRDIQASFNRKISAGCNKISA